MSLICRSNGCPVARCYDVPDLSVQRLRTLSPIREVVVAVVVVVVVRLAKRRAVLRRGTVCDRDPWRCVWRGEMGGTRGGGDGWTREGETGGGWTRWVGGTIPSTELSTPQGFCTKMGNSAIRNDPLTEGVVVVGGGGQSHKTVFTNHNL